jgi:isocitrate dehydrogenase
MLLSGVMMLEYMKWNEAADLITKALENMFESGIATHDLARFMANGQSLTTSEFSEQLVQKL